MWGESYRNATEKGREFINTKKEMKYFLRINFVINFGNQLVTFYRGILVS